MEFQKMYFRLKKKKKSIPDRRSEMQKETRNKEVNIYVKLNEH